MGCCTRTCLIRLILGTFLVGILIKIKFYTRVPTAITHSMYPRMMTQNLLAAVETQNKTLLHGTIELKKNILCVAYLGRLGNMMFQIAAGYAIAKRKGLNLVFNRGDPLSKIFNIPITNLTSFGRVDNPCSYIDDHITDRWHSAYDPEIENHVFSDKDAFLEGYFQSWKYWTDLKHDIRKLFTFQSHILEKAISNIKSINDYKSNIRSILVGIHVRRGDYILGASVGKTSATEHYFRTAMKYYREKYKDVIFIVVSDDFKWCKTTFRNESNLNFMEGNSPAVDMAIMSMTNHTIMSVGSYGWWGSWLANGTTIYYEELFTPGTGNAGNFLDIHDYILPHWIPMK